MGKVKTYKVSLSYEFIIKTDDIVMTRHNYEFPTFPDLESDNAVEYVTGYESWDEQQEEDEK